MLIPLWDRKEVKGVYRDLYLVPLDVYNEIKDAVDSFEMNELYDGQMHEYGDCCTLTTNFCFISTTANELKDYVFSHDVFKRVGFTVCDPLDR